MKIIVFKMEKGSFCSKWAYSDKVKKTNVSHERKSSVIEAGTSTTLFHCEN
jgi:hypothetical protein